LTCPAFIGASTWHMILKSTKRRIKQLFKATEKTFIIGRVAPFSDCVLDELGG
jgi:hypothetical protein